MVRMIRLHHMVKVTNREHASEDRLFFGAWYLPECKKYSLFAAPGTDTGPSMEQKGHHRVQASAPMCSEMVLHLLIKNLDGNLGRYEYLAQELVNFSDELRAHAQTREDNGQ